MDLECSQTEKKPLCGRNTEVVSYVLHLIVTTETTTPQYLLQKLASLS